jgi:hypothetical protein
MAKKTGRPTTYTKETAAKICAGLSEGKSLRTVCLDEGMPALSTIFLWFREYPEFSEQYVTSKNESADARLEQLDDLGDEAIALAQSVDPKASSAVVQAVKLKADNIKWTMSKLKPKKYGDKLDLTSDGKVLPTPIYGGVAEKKSE